MLSIKSERLAVGARWATAVLAVCAPALAGCQGGLDPVRFQGISGTVAFRGTPPDSTDWVRLVVYREMPRSIDDLFNFAAFSDPLPLDVPEHVYYLSLEAGEYAWLLAVWKKVGGSFTSETLREAGSYYGEQDPSEGPAAFPVASRRETPGIDLVVDFDQMRSVEDLFPPAGALSP